MRRANHHTVHFPLLMAQESDNLFQNIDASAAKVRIISPMGPHMPCPYHTNTADSQEALDSSSPK